MTELPKNVFKCGGVEKGRGELDVCLNLGRGRKYGEWDERLPLYLVVMMCCQGGGNKLLSGVNIKLFT